MMPKVRDRILGGFLVVLGVSLLFYIIPEGVVVPRSVKSVALSPSLWPRVVAGLFIIIGIIIFIKSIFPFWARANEAVADADTHDSAPSPRPYGPAYVVAAALGLFVYYGLIHLLGIPVASALAILYFAFLYAEYRYMTVVAVAVLVPVGLYLFFEHVAHVPIPMGLFTG